MAKDDKALSEADVDQFLEELDAEQDTQAAEPGTETPAPAEAEAQATEGTDAAASDESPDESPDQPAAEGESPAPSSADTTPDPKTDPPAPAGSEPAPEGAEGSKRESFTVNVYGQPVEITGAYQEKDRKWIRIPTESWERIVQPRLADPRAIQEREVAHRRELTRITEERSLVDTQATNLLKKFDEVVTLAAQDPAQSLAKWEELVADFPRFKLEQERAYWERQAKQPNAEAAERQQREQHEALDTEVRSGLTGYADEALKLKEYADVAPAMRDDLVKALHRSRFNLVRATGEKHTSGLPKLEVDWGLFKEIVEEVAGTHRRFAQQIKSVEEAARKNAARLTPRPVAPPAPGAARQPKSQEKKGTSAAPKSWDEVQDAAASMTLDD